ncbi:MAG: ABC transporter permease [Bryobacterales bacterium]|nr:ABC transporter permease [Bryobacterales bacterium]
MRQFEFFVANRYLRAKRKQAMISVITGISVLGVAAGVMALVIALAINNGFRGTLQSSLLGATAHVTVLEKNPGPGITNWQEIIPRLVKLPHVVSASPTLYAPVMLVGAAQSSGCVIKGIVPEPGPQLPAALRKLGPEALAGLRANEPFPGIVLGAQLALSSGSKVGQLVSVISPQGELTPFGPRSATFRFRVVGTFESGFYDLDSTWAFISLEQAQRIESVENTVNAIELKLDDIYKAPQVAAAISKMVGPKLDATTWMEQNHALLNALKMERYVTVITIGLIVLVAGLNILISLVMMVMEKYRDIAILMSMGARAEQIRRIFVLQGVMIGVVGTAIGLILGYGLSLAADHYRWIPLDEQVYALSYVPFDPRWFDGIWIAAIAIGVSLIATLYPARTATRVAPAEALRYE